MLALCLMLSMTYYAQNYTGMHYRPGPGPWAHAEEQCISSGYT